jgi:NADP-dependent 3-hydroxy acid dehydrogenase YdfG
MDLNGNVAIVTGASRGLGRAIASSLAEAGMHVALAARDAESLRDAVREIDRAGGSAIAVPTDVRNYESILRLVANTRDTFGPVDVVVNNAGLGWLKPFADYSVAEIDQAIDVNFRGTVYLTKAVLAEMLERKRGHLINIASDVARRPQSGLAIYAAAKHGVLGFGSSLLREVKGSGVKVTTVTPGIIDTYFGGSEPGRDETWAMQPEWVAEVVLWLLQSPPHWLADEIALHPLGQDF